MVVVHHLNNSGSQRVLWLLEELGVPYEVKRHERDANTELGAHAWFAGEEFTAADVQMSFPLEAAASRAGLNASRPKLMAYLDRIHAREAYKRALDRGGKYDFASSLNTVES
jgi:glutathione S-transferase